MAHRTEQIENILKSLPDEPGIYQYFNSDGTLIYVGKAKNLKKRVTSYFSKEIFENAKTKVMVKNIADIKFIITGTEYEALLLENNLIKKHQPRYNVSLKDDKTYPWIIIKNEPFPRVFYTRKKIKDGSEYYGPYPSVRMIHTLLDFFRQLYMLRNCNLSLTQENIEKKKFKVCLEYHIKNCKGPCEGLQTSADYDEAIAGIREILKGNISSVIQHFNDQMKQHAAAYQFEQAQALKTKIELLDNFRSRSVVAHPSIHNVDVFTVVLENNAAFVNYLKVNNGSVVQALTIEMKKKLDETPEELIGLAIAELRTRFESDAREVLVNVMPDVELENVTFTIPKIGDKKHLLMLSEKNALYAMREKMEQYDKLNPEHKTERILNLLMNDLRMKELPRYIECFDNSNFQGTDAVAAMSVFKDAKPSKKDYRHFNIKTVEGPDDFASMEEVIYRRYKRLVEENQPLPQLIVIDGGKGQLSAALKSLEKLHLRGKITIIGIAKKLEEIYFPGDGIPLYLDKKGESLKIIQHLRDEVHRFGITHHRNKRSKGLIKTELENIEGIGKATAESLLREFKSVKKIKEATTEQLVAVIGNAKAKVVKDYFQS